MHNDYRHRQNALSQRRRRLDDGRRYRENAIRAARLAFTRGKIDRPERDRRLKFIERATADGSFVAPLRGIGGAVFAPSFPVSIPEELLP